MSATIYAQNYTVNNIQPYIKNDSLNIELSCNNLFTGNSKKALLAGIPLSFELNIILKDKNRTHIKTNVTFLINYEVWEEYYFIVGNTASKIKFNSLMEIISWFNKVKIVNLLPVKEASSVEYKIEVHSNLIILSQKQNNQLNKWLRQASQTEEELPSQNRSVGFKLNLNKFIRVFIEGSKQPEEFSGVFYSKSFKIGELEEK